MQGSRVVRSIGLILFLLPAFPYALQAQVNGIKVLRRTPADSGTPGTLVTVTFDRPVAGMLGSAVDARRVLSISPDVNGTTEWRDPATLRFVPNDPFTPGSRYTVSVDTAAVASNGKRSGAPYQFVARFPGATPLAFDPPHRTWQTYAPTIGPLQSLRILYSAPVSLDSVEAHARLEMGPGCGGTVRLRATGQSPVADRNDYFWYEGAEDRDTVGDRFRRVVTLVPRDSLPPGCSGSWHIPPFDRQQPEATWSYLIRTAAQFTVRSVEPCIHQLVRDNPLSVCDPDGLQIEFAVPISTTNLHRLIHISPPGPRPPPNGQTASIINFNGRLVPAPSTR